MLKSGIGFFEKGVLRFEIGLLRCELGLLRFKMQTRRALDIELEGLLDKRLECRCPREGCSDAQDQGLRPCRNSKQSQSSPPFKLVA
jgi:hypothetical protein